MANPLLKRLRPKYEALLQEYKDYVFPLVDVNIATMRPSYKEELVEKINAQTVRIGRVVIAAENYSAEDKLYIANNLTNGTAYFIEFNPDTCSLGQRHNLMLDVTTATMVAIIDDDDVYYPNYLRGQLATMLKEGTLVTSKANPICHRLDLDKRGFLADEYLPGRNRRSAGGALVFNRNVVDIVGGFADIPSGYDSDFLLKLRAKNIHFSDSLPFDFIVTRGVDGGHTWNTDHLSFKDVMANSTTVEDVKVILEP